MSYPALPHYSCPQCGEKFFTPFSLSAHRAQVHYESEKIARMKRSVQLAKESRKRNETPDWTEE